MQRGRILIREVVLSKVNSLVKDFVYKATLARGLPESIAATSGGKIFSFVRLTSDAFCPCFVHCIYSPTLSSFLGRVPIVSVCMDQVPISTHYALCPDTSNEKTSSPSLRRCSEREMMSKRLQPYPRHMCPSSIQSLWASRSTFCLPGLLWRESKTTWSCMTATCSRISMRGTCEVWEVR